MSSNLYASVEEFKDRMGVTDGTRDFAFDRVLQSASRAIDRFCGRRFYTTSADETRYYTLRNWDYPARWPYPYCDRICDDDVLSITTFETDDNGDGVFDTTWVANTDYHLEPLNAPLDGEPYTCIVRNGWTGRFSLPTYPNSIRVTGKFGYCTLANVPPAVREATLGMAEVDARPVLDMAMPGVFTYKLGTELTVTMEARTMPARVAQLIEPYRKRAYIY